MRLSDRSGEVSRGRSSRSRKGRTKAQTVGRGKYDAHLMGIAGQNIQMRLAFPEGDWGAAPGASRAGTEMPVAVCAPESPAEDGSLMEEVCERENLTEALKRVRANRGSPGVDGMRVEELAGYLKEH